MRCSHACRGARRSPVLARWFARLFVVFVVTAAAAACCCVIYEPIISVLVCFFDFVHDFVCYIFDGLTCRRSRDDIQRLSVSARIVVFFDDFFDFRGHLGRRHFFVVEVIITRRWFEIGGG